VNRNKNLRLPQILENLLDTRGNSENFLRPELTIYRGGGGGGRSFKKPPRFDRCEVPEDACPLRRSEGDIFYLSSKVFVETDRRSQLSSPRG
jgi:hypothetical protein